MTHLAHALPWEWACAYMSAPDEGHIRVWEQAAAVAGGMGHLGPTPAPAIFYAALPAFATALEARFFKRTASYGLRAPEKLRRIAATFPLFHAVFSFPFSSLTPDFPRIA